MLQTCRALLVVLVFVCVPLTTALAQEPTRADLRYSNNHERSVMDVWLPRGAQSAPIVVYFHGGGFIGGDKSKIQLKPDFLRLPSRGIAFASVNYPLIPGQRNRSTESIFAVLEETSLAIDFIKANASQLVVDPDSIVIAGSSAGSLITEYLAYIEPVGVDAAIAINQPRGGEYSQSRFYSDMPPLFLHTLAGAGDEVHHPRFAVEMKQACDRVGARCFLSGSSRSGLPALPGGDLVSFVMRELYGL